MIREKILTDFSIPPKERGLYDMLKDSLRVNFSYEGINHKLTLSEIDSFSNSFADTWFRGIVESLYYKPNTYVMVLYGEQGIGKTEFFRKLLPDISLYGESPVGMYYNLIVNIDEITSKDLKKLPANDGFIIFEENINKLVHPACDKRLASYCATANNWHNPQRKHNIVYHVDSIDFEKYNSIDKMELWREIFQIFKPK